jgi:hypothetical protein
MKKIGLVTIFFLVGCQTIQTNNIRPSDAFIFFEKSLTDLIKSYPNLENDGDIEINKKMYFQKNAKINGKDQVQFIIDKSTLNVVEVVKLDANTNQSNFLKSSDSKTYVPKCLNNSSRIEYSTQRKEMTLLKEDKVVFYARSNLIDERIQDDKAKACIRSWKH